MQPQNPVDSVIASLFAARSRADNQDTIQYIESAIYSIIDEWGHSGTVPPLSEQTDPLEVGDRAPEFELPGVGPDGVDQFRLADYTATGPVLLSFYPFDFSPVCTSHHCTFRDIEWLNVSDEFDVFAISVDSVYSHRAFRDQNEFHFPLLTDRLASVADTFGVKYDIYERHASVCKRALFAIDETGEIRYRWYTGDAQDEPSIDDVEASLAWAR